MKDGGMYHAELVKKEGNEGVNLSCFATFPLQSRKGSGRPGNDQNFGF